MFKHKDINVALNESLTQLFFSYQLILDDHEVDAMGYNGSTSDDDHSSVRSSNSDGGVTITTWKQLAIDA